MNYSFEENEMPYDILERFGLTQEVTSFACTYHGRRW